VSRGLHYDISEDDAADAMRDETGEGVDSADCLEIAADHDPCDFWSPFEYWGIPVCSPFDPCCSNDCDGDGIMDLVDLDDDDDTIPDSIEYELIERDSGQCWYRDTDQDFRPDGLDTESDGDGICDLLEQAMGLDPYSSDTDGDGMSDSAEIWLGFDPMNEADFFIGQVIYYDVSISGCPDYYSNRGHVFLTAMSSCEAAHLLLSDSSEPLLGMTGSDCVLSAAAVSVEPESYGRVTPDGQVADLVTAATVTLEMELTQPNTETCLPCPFAFMMTVELICADGRTVASEQVMIGAEFRSDPIDFYPFTNGCGLFPECPPRDW